MYAPPRRACTFALLLAVFVAAEQWRRGPRLLAPPYTCAHVHVCVNETRSLALATDWLLPCHVFPRRGWGIFSRRACAGERSWRWRRADLERFSSRQGSWRSELLASEGLWRSRKQVPGHGMRSGQGVRAPRLRLLTSCGSTRAPWRASARPRQNERDDQN